MRLCSIAAMGVVASAMIALGCGATSDATPVACLDGSGAYIGALGDAPGDVLLSGEVPISECLAENQKGGDLATVGVSMLEAATKLNAEAREEPGGAANLQLGYLVGAATRGAQGTEGIHADLLRRLGAAGRYSPGGRALPRTFYRAYRSGYAAGQDHG